jgi:hypothetical protein
MAIKLYCADGGRGGNTRIRTRAGSSVCKRDKTGVRKAWAHVAIRRESFNLQLFSFLASR